MIIMGRRIDDRVVIVGLVLGSAAIIWSLGVVTNLLIGISAGLLVSAIHGLLRNTEEIFLDETDGAYAGLISSTSQNGEIF